MKPSWKWVSSKRHAHVHCGAGMKGNERKPPILGQTNLGLFFLHASLFEVGFKGKPMDFSPIFVLGLSPYKYLQFKTPIWVRLFGKTPKMVAFTLVFLSSHTKKRKEDILQKDAPNILFPGLDGRCALGHRCAHQQHRGDHTHHRRVGRHRLSSFGSLERRKRGTL